MPRAPASVASPLALVILRKVAVTQVVRAEALDGFAVQGVGFSIGGRFEAARNGSCAAQTAGQFSAIAPQSNWAWPAFSITSLGLVCADAFRPHSGAHSGAAAVFVSTYHGTYVPTVEPKPKAGIDYV